MTGRHDTRASRSTWSWSRGPPGRNHAIQADVSTRTTSLPACGPIAAHRGQVAAPRAGSLEVENLPGSGSPDHVLERPEHSGRIGAFAAHALRLGEEGRIKHKIGTFHVYSVRSRSAGV